MNHDSLIVDTAIALPEAVDVVILGGGPAGLATAIKLAISGYPVVVLAREERGGDKIGESLAPASQPILKQLGVWEAFLQDSHLPCYGNKSAWGGPHLESYSFIYEPNGHGWHINRCRFEQQLWERAAELGVLRLQAASLHQIDRDHDQWQLTLKSRSKAQMKARFVVDATGRASWFARRQGVQRRSEDRQIALIAFLKPTEAPIQDSTSLVEALADGWWYSALLPDGRLATAFFTDPDLCGSLSALSDCWFDRLSLTKYTQERVNSSSYYLDGQPRLVAASGGRLNRFIGEGWLAVGDAAMTYDPLSAHGLTLALAEGTDAADAIIAHFSGERSALTTYEDRLESAYVRYLSRRRQIYAAESRWPESLFWQRRCRNSAYET
ncbi:MAG: tryptophan 7-halogenase [Scytonema sp. PMC 1069.18]|nr:tryptophan 7-halogenase [Scytonema sp. PMC 1069.18]MEC4884879.1 tryptophan 7-halogenase [Scytonema sp. PMC 1070.18]